MKKSLLGLCALALSAMLSVPATAAPFNVVDVLSPDVNVCVYKASAAATPIDVAVTVDNAYGKSASGFRVCKVDLATAPVGANAATFQAKNSLWGLLGPEQSASFTRPAALSGSALGTSQLLP